MKTWMFECNETAAKIIEGEPVDKKSGPKDPDYLPDHEAHNWSGYGPGNHKKIADQYHDSAREHIDQAAKARVNGDKRKQAEHEGLAHDHGAIADFHDKMAKEKRAKTLTGKAVSKQSGAIDHKRDVEKHMDHDWSGYTADQHKKLADYHREKEDYFDDKGDLGKADAHQDVKEFHRQKWFDKLSKEAQDEYRKKHPGTKL